MLQGVLSLVVILVAASSLVAADGDFCRTWRDEMLKGEGTLVWKFSTDEAPCVEGVLQPSASAAALHRVNYYRAIAGLSPVVESSGKSLGCQKAASMLKACGSEECLTRDPQAEWECSSAAGVRALSSGIFATGLGSPANLVGEITLSEESTYLRQMLCPWTSAAGFGQVDEFSCVWMSGFDMTPSDVSTADYEVEFPLGDVPLSALPEEWLLGSSRSLTGATITVTKGSSTVSAALTVLDSNVCVGMNWLAIRLAEPVSEGAYTVTVTLAEGQEPISYVVQVHGCAGRALATSAVNNGLSCADDTDGDGIADCFDACPQDHKKTLEGVCGCGRSDEDTDGDGTPDCVDACPSDKTKSDNRGKCGCGETEKDTDKDGQPDCTDECPVDPHKFRAGKCGCGVAEIDSDGDRVPDCLDECPMSALKSVNDLCGCDVAMSPCGCNVNSLTHDCSEVVATFDHSQGGNLTLVGAMGSAHMHVQVPRFAFMNPEEALTMSRQRADQGASAPGAVSDLIHLHLESTDSVHKRLAEKSSSAAKSARVNTIMGPIPSDFASHSANEHRFTHETEKDYQRHVVRTQFDPALFTNSRRDSTKYKQEVVPNKNGKKAVEGTKANLAGDAPMEPWHQVPEHPTGVQGCNMRTSERPITVCADHHLKGKDLGSTCLGFQDCASGGWVCEDQQLTMSDHGHLCGRSTKVTTLQFFEVTEESAIAPIIERIWPMEGPTDGRVQVTIAGEHFLMGTLKSLHVGDYQVNLHDCRIVAKRAHDTEYIICDRFPEGHGRDLDLVAVFSRSGLIDDITHHSVLRAAFSYARPFLSVATSRGKDVIIHGHNFGPKRVLERGSVLVDSMECRQAQVSHDHTQIHCVSSAVVGSNDHHLVSVHMQGVRVNSTAPMWIAPCTGERTFLCRDGTCAADDSVACPTCPSGAVRCSLMHPVLMGDGQCYSLRHQAEHNPDLYEITYDATVDATLPLGLSGFLQVRGHSSLSAPDFKTCMAIERVGAPQNERNIVSEVFHVVGSPNGRWVRVALRTSVRPDAQCRDAYGRAMDPIKHCLDGHGYCLGLWNNAVSRWECADESLEVHDAYMIGSMMLEDGAATFAIMRDNCPNHSNGDQVDSDMDGLGDSCDMPAMCDPRWAHANFQYIRDAVQERARDLHNCPLKDHSCSYAAGDYLAGQCSMMY